MGKIACNGWQQGTYICTHVHSHDPAHRLSAHDRLPNNSAVKKNSRSRNCYNRFNCGFENPFRLPAFRLHAAPVDKACAAQENLYAIRRKCNAFIAFGFSSLLVDLGTHVRP